MLAISTLSDCGSGAGERVEVEGGMAGAGSRSGVTP